MAWAKNGTPHTLGSGADILTITDLDGLDFNVFLIHTTGSSAFDYDTTFNSDSGTSYNRRGSNNGATDFTSTNQLMFESFSTS